LTNKWFIFKFSKIKHTSTTTATNRRISQQNYVPSPPVGHSQGEIQLKKDLQRQHMLDYVFESEERSAAKRAFRQQTLLEQEKQMEESMRRAHDEKQARTKALEQEEKLAMELERHKLEQLRDAKMRQQLRETR
jgi:hypothetical protein